MLKEKIVEKTELKEDDTIVKAGLKGFVDGVTDAFIILGAIWYIVSLGCVLTGKKLDIRAINKK